MSTGAADEVATRDRVLDAAVACILDRGYYRASSNEIARRAGVTWGVIQHHFGTREELLLAVLRRQFDRFAATLATAEIVGRATTDRLTALADVVWSYYGQPEYLAIMQIQLNLSRDPKRVQATVDAMVELDARLRDGWSRLVRQVAGDARIPGALARSIFRVLRGMAIGDVVAMGGPQEVVDTRIDPAQRTGDLQVVVEALAVAVDAHR